METQNRVPFTTTMGVLSIFLVINCSFVVNPMIASLASIYEADGIAYSTVLMLSTVVSLLVIPFSLLSGAIAGKTVRYKTLAVLALLLAIVGGVGPYFVHSFYVVLVFRALVGAAIGIASPLSSALVSRLFSGERAATMQGIGNETMAGTIGSCYTVGGMIAGIAFGALYKHTGKFVIPVAMICEVCGLALGYWSTLPALLMAGSFLTGFAIFTIWPASIMRFTEALPPEKIVTASGIFTACLGLGGFLTSPYVAIITRVSGNDSPRLPLLVGVVLTAVIGVIWSAAEIRKKSA